MLGLIAHLSHHIVILYLAIFHVSHHIVSLIYSPRFVRTLFFVCQLLTFGMSSLARRASIALEAAAEDDTMLDGEKSPRLRESGSIEANPGVSTGVGLGQEVVAASTSGRQGGGGSGQGTNNFDIMTAQVTHLSHSHILTLTFLVRCLCHCC